VPGIARSTSSLRCFFSKVMTSIPSACAKDSIASTNLFVIGAMSRRRKRSVARHLRKNHPRAALRLQRRDDRIEVQIRSIPSHLEGHVAAQHLCPERVASYGAPAVTGPSGPSDPLRGPGRKPILGSVGAAPL